MKKICAILIAGLSIVSALGALPALAGGDSPAAIYGLYLAELKNGDIEGMCEYVTEEKVKQLEAIPQAQQQQMVAMVQMMAPVEYTVIEEKIDGDTATLVLTGKGKDFSGNITDQKGTVTFKKEGGAWKVVKEKWGPADS